MTGYNRAILPNQLSASAPNTHPDQQTAYAECLHTDGLVILQESIHCCDQARTGSTAIPGGYGHTGRCTKKPLNQLWARDHKRHDEPTLAIGVFCYKNQQTAGCNVNMGNLPTSWTSWETTTHTPWIPDLLCVQSAQTLLPPVHLFLFLLKAKIMGRQKFFSNIKLRFCSLPHGSAVSQSLLFGYRAGDNQLWLTAIVTLLFLVDPTDVPMRQILDRLGTEENLTLKLLLGMKMTKAVMIIIKK